MSCVSQAGFSRRQTQGEKLGEGGDTDVVAGAPQAAEVGQAGKALSPCDSRGPSLAHLARSSDSRSRFRASLPSAAEPGCGRLMAQSVTAGRIPGPRTPGPFPLDSP